MSFYIKLIMLGGGIVDLSVPKTGDEELDADTFSLVMQRIEEGKMTTPGENFPAGARAEYMGEYLESINMSRVIGIRWSFDEPIQLTNEERENPLAFRTTSIDEFMADLPRQFELARVWEKRAAAHSSEETASAVDAFFE